MYLATTGQLQLNTYTTATSYSGTAAGYLAFDSSGNVITVAGVAATDNTKLPLAGGTLTGNVTFGAGTRFPDTNGTIDSLWGVYGWDGQLQFTKRNISTDGYMGTAMFIDYGGLYVQSDYSFRAPIFYDSADTNYYIDANSNSNIATLTLNGNDNQLKIDSPTNGASGIFYRENGVNRWETYHYQGRLRFYSYVTNQEELSLDNSGGFLTSRTSMRAPIFYDSQDTNYYLDPNGTSRLYLVNAPQGYVSNGNPWSTADSAFFPNGITTAGSRNWIYGATYIGNAPGNGQGVDIGASGNAYFRSNVGTSSHGTSARFLEIQNANGNFIPYSFESEYGNHSWGTVMRIRINQSGADRPSIQFSSASNDTRWNVGYCYADDNFRVTQNMGYRNDNSTSDGWGTERFRINTDGNTYAAIGGTLYANGTQVVTNNGGTWNIAISGNSASVSGLTATQFFNNMGNNHGAYANFNDVGGFGFRYVQGNTNGPSTGATQYYGVTVGLGNDYAWGTYGSQLYWNRVATGGNPYLSVRFQEGGSWGSWSKIYAGYADSAGNADTVDGEHASNFATHRGEGRNYVDYSRYVYNNGAYSGSGWNEPSDLGVRYANSAGSSTSTVYMNTQFQGSGSVNTSEGRCMSLRTDSGAGAAVNYAPVLHMAASDTMWQAQGTYGSSGNGTLYFRQGYAGNWGNWLTMISSANIGSQSVNYASTSGTASNLSGFDKNNPSFGAVYSDNWFRAYNDTGLYSQSYGGHIRRSLGSSFGNWETFGYERNGWSGFCYVHNYLLNIMSNTSGDHGFYQENGNGWTLFYNRGNNCWGIGTDNTYSGDGFRCVKYGSSQYGWTTWSDRRAKENITSITGALDKVLNMRGVYFNYISDDTKTQRVGFIAQELEQVLPEAVRYAEEIDEYNVEYAQIVSVLTEAIKEQDAKITRLEALVEQLTNN
jgi:Chaperone of endosialidase